MSQDLETLAKYENWKQAKKRRIARLQIFAFLLTVPMAYITSNLLCKVGLTETKKIFSYSWGIKEDGLKTENQKNLPKDYTEWYKKVKENVWVKNFGKKEGYFTKGEILKRKVEKEKKEVGIEGGILGNIADWWLSQGLSEEEAKKVDYYHYAKYVYGFTAIFLILSWVLFYIVFYLLFRYLILPLIWREPKLIE